jgi:SAM-dependent MidA family methyltransferase
LNEPESLEQQIKNRIRLEGPLTYETFIDVVLYDEKQGYYREGKPYRKDYYTSPEIHPVFGKTLAAYIDRVRALCDRAAVTILELGGGSGVLAHQMTSLQKEDSSPNYFVVEKGKPKEADRTVWVNDVADLPRIENFVVIIANEFFDALPFHRVAMTESGLREIYLDFADGFVELLGPLTPEVEAFLGTHPIHLHLHQTVEVTTRTVEILRRTNEVVKEALLLLIDYGYHSQDVAHGRFFDGSMIGYKNLVMREDVFQGLGTMDITHHVNFDHLTRTLDHLGWRKVGEIEQYRFLLNIGILDQLMALPDAERISAKALINPHGLGSMLSVLGFTKNLSCDVPGFRQKKSFCDTGKV